MTNKQSTKGSEIMPYPNTTDTTLGELFREADIVPGKLATMLEIKPVLIYKLIDGSSAPIYLTGPRKGEPKKEVVAIAKYFNTEVYELFPNFFKEHHESYRLYHVNNCIKISSSKYAENRVFTKELIEKLKKKFPKFTNMFECLAYGKCTKLILEEENITHACFVARLRCCRNFLMKEVRSCDDTEYC